MNRLKAWYVIGALSGQFAGFAYSLIAALRGAAGDAWPWLGAAAAVGALPLRLGSIYIVPQARTSAMLPDVLVASAAGVAVALVASGRAFGSAPVILAFVGLASSVIYVFWYSRLGRRHSTALTIGRMLPKAPLEDGESRPTDLRRYIGRPALLLFYRGNWCPLCMAQVREIAGQYRELDRRGVKVALISPQPDKQTQALAKRFDVPFDFLVDRGARAARQLGIVHDGGLPAGMNLLGYDRDTVFPTVVLTDATGRIIFSDQTDNYRVRPEPSTFLALFDKQSPHLEATPMMAARGG